MEGNRGMKTALSLDPRQCDWCGYDIDGEPAIVYRGGHEFFYHHDSYPLDCYTQSERTLAEIKNPYLKELWEL